MSPEMQFQLFLKCFLMESTLARMFFCSTFVDTSINVLFCLFLFVFLKLLNY